MHTENFSVGKLFLIFIVALAIIVGLFAVPMIISHRSTGYAPDYDSISVSKDYLLPGNIPDSELFYSGDTLFFEGVKYIPVN